MKILTSNITEYWYNKIIANTEEGYTVEIVLRYYPYVSFWIADIKCEEESFEVKGVRISNSPNILECYKNKITFGLSCISQNNNVDPVFINDFSSGNSALYLLNSSEVNASFNGDYDKTFGVV